LEFEVSFEFLGEVEEGVLQEGGFGFTKQIAFIRELDGVLFVDLGYFLEGEF